jgi:ATP/maltotriose-dependent transcriptional regulator MalT
LEEAAELCRRAADHAGREDIATQAIWRGVLGRVLAAEGRCGEARALAREAVALAEPTDLLSLRGDAMLDLAAVSRTCKRTEAGEAARAALALYELKGNVAAAARARSLLTDAPGGGD